MAHITSGNLIKPGKKNLWTTPKYAMDPVSEVITVVNREQFVGWVFVRLRLIVIQGGVFNDSEVSCEIYASLWKPSFHGL